MTDRACFLLLILGALMVALAGDAFAGEGQPDTAPSSQATSSAPVADRDAATPGRAEDALEHAHEAVHAGRWLVLAGILLGFLVKGGRELGAWLGGRWAWFKTDRGGATLALALAILGEVSLLLTTGRTPSVSGFAGALAAVAVAAGGRNLISRILAPRDLGGPPGWR